MSEVTFMGVSRGQIDWSPRIDYTKCDDCMACVAFCHCNVFQAAKEGETTEAHKVIVANPDNCVVFCWGCRDICGPDAIAFPDAKDTTNHIKALKKEAVEIIVDQLLNQKEVTILEDSGFSFPEELTYDTYRKDKFVFRMPTNKGFYVNENNCWAFVVGNKARIGITDFVQKSLSDIVFFTAPPVGTHVDQFEDAATIESMKAIFEVVSPVSGTITAVNARLTDTPELLNENPYEQGWIMEMTLTDFESDKELLHEFDGYMAVLKGKVDEFHV